MVMDESPRVCTITNLESLATFLGNPINTRAAITTCRHRCHQREEHVDLPGGNFKLMRTDLTNTTITTDLL